MTFLKKSMKKIDLLGAFLVLVASISLVFALEKDENRYS